MWLFDTWLLCHWPPCPVPSCRAQEAPAVSLQKHLCPLFHTWWAAQRWRKGWKKSSASSQSWLCRRSRRRTDTRRAGSRRPEKQVGLQMNGESKQYIQSGRGTVKQLQHSPHSYRRSRLSCWPDVCSTSVREPGGASSGVWSERWRNHLPWLPADGEAGVEWLSQPGQKKNLQHSTSEDLHSDLHALLTRDPNPNIGCLDHVYIICTIT